MNNSEKKKVTIYSVANEAGVSLATVSRVINDSGLVKQETKEKVGDPYIKTTCDYRVDVYKHKGDEEPIRTYQKQFDVGCAVKTLALVGGAACLIVCAATILAKKD